jgi:hypothetical protein
MDTRCSNPAHDAADVNPNSAGTMQCCTSRGVQATFYLLGSSPAAVRRGRDLARSVSDEEAKKAYPQGWKAPLPYLRIVPQPNA